MIRRVKRWFRPARPDPEASRRALRSRIADWDVKVLGSALAAQHYAHALAGEGAPKPAAPSRTGFAGRLCRQEDIESDWLRFWCAQMKLMPLYHRKLWEDCYAVQMLYERGMLAEGRRGIGFAVGDEWLPAFFASCGVDVLATDLPEDDPRARDWIATNQHGGRETALFKPEVVDEELFRRHVSLRAVDMTAIPADLDARGGSGFDFLWSVCSLEHCGSLERGADFVVEAMRCLRPGGIAVHTTEFNMNPEGSTLETGGTVLYQRRHIEALGDRLEAAGHRMLPVDYAVGDRVLDGFVDLPPYEHEPWFMPRPVTPHLRLELAGHVVTSIGFVVVAGG